MKLTKKDKAVLREAAEHHRRMVKVHADDIPYAADVGWVALYKKAQRKHRRYARAIEKLLGEVAGGS